MNKICTDIEQSKKLIELGIDINSADMHYSNWTIVNEDGEFILSTNQGGTIEELQELYGYQVIPAWSLSALLELMPKYYELRVSEDKYNIWIPGRNCNVWLSSPFDAAYEMVVWLKENNKI